jgi:hypothetical protein
MIKLLQSWQIFHDEGDLLNNLCPCWYVPARAEGNFMVFLVRLSTEEGDITFRVFVGNGKSQDTGVKIFGPLQVGAVDSHMTQFFNG